MVEFASGIAQVYQVWQLALASNWFGLQCPLHCGYPSLPALGFSFLLGLLLGVILCLTFGFFLARYLGGFRPSSHPSSAHQGRPPPEWVLSRLRGYRVWALRLWLISHRRSIRWRSRWRSWLWWLAGLPFLRSLLAPTRWFRQLLLDLLPLWFPLLALPSRKWVRVSVVPDFAVHLCSGLSAGSLSFKRRAERAWESGYWARFVLEGKINKPRPSKPIDVSNTLYVVLKAEGYECPLLCSKASDYRFVLQGFTAGTLSHGFASQAEARVYCLGAGVEYPTRYFRWTPQQ